MLRFCHWQITLSEAKRSSGRAQQKQPGPELVAPGPVIEVSAK